MKLLITPIKAGYAARIEGIPVSAHGFSEEVARINLVRLVKFYFAPFAREDMLMEELQRLGIPPVDTIDSITIATFTDPGGDHEAGAR